MEYTACEGELLPEGAMTSFTVCNARILLLCKSGIQGGPKK